RGSDDFRSYAEFDLALARGTTAFVGANGAGKTNLLEAIHLAARGDSPRAHDDTEMVRWGTTAARVRIEVDRPEGQRRIELVLFSPPEGERRRPRRDLLDGAGKRPDDLGGERALRWCHALFTRSALAPGARLGVRRSGAGRQRRGTDRGIRGAPAREARARTLAGRDAGRAASRRPARDRGRPRPPILRVP